MRTFAAAKGNGKMPEWSIGPHSKCGVRATVPGVRIPLFPPQRAVTYHCSFFVAEREGFVQSVVFRATNLRMAVVCCRKSLSLADDCL